MLSTRVRILAAAIVAATASIGSAATSWTTPAGSSSTISYSNGQTATGHFTETSPVVTSDQFIFDPAGFSSTDNATISDIASAVITANSGRNLSHVTAQLAGDYSILGVGSVDAIGSLKVTNTVTHAVVTQSFNFGGFPGTTGIFNDSVDIALPAGWTSAQVDLSATLSSTAGGNIPSFAAAIAPGGFGTSFIQLKTASFGAETVKSAAVPLPPAALAAVPAIVIAGFARRRLRTA